MVQLLENALRIKRENKKGCAGDIAISWWVQTIPGVSNIVFDQTQW